MVEVPIFLETTIQADRVVGTNDRKEVIKSNLAGKTLASSTCVLGEFLQTFLHDAVLFQKLVVDSPTTSDALKRLQRYPERTNKRAVSIFASVTENGNMDKADVLDVLEQWIEWGLIHRFHQGLATIVNPANCAKARASPVKENGTYRLDGLACSKDDPPDCAIESFLLAYHDKLQQVLTVIRTIASRDDDQNRVIQVGQKWLDGLDTPFGRNCQALKDVIIALEAPDQYEIYTTNRKHFEPICIALRKNLFRES